MLAIEISRFGGPEVLVAVERARPVPAGFLGKRYPFGVSFLGRPWADRRTLAIAYAYEQATHHRVPPPRRP